METPRARLEATLKFIRSYGLQAMTFNGEIHFECTNGHRYKVRTLAEAREILLGL